MKNDSSPVKEELAVDIKPSWLKPIRAAQAACTRNRGYAVVQLILLVDKNDPIMWLEPQLLKVHPSRLTESNISPMLLAALLENLPIEELDKG